MNDPTLANPKNKGWIGVDLDGTLAHYDGWKGYNHIGEPIPGMVQRVKDWLAAGQEVRIFTARVAAMDHEEYIHWLETVLWPWCLKHVGQRLPAIATKDMQMIELWDDRATQVITNSGMTVDEHYNKLVRDYDD